MIRERCRIVLAPALIISRYMLVKLNTPWGIYMYTYNVSEDCVSMWAPFPTAPNIPPMDEWQIAQWCGKLCYFIYIICAVDAPAGVGSGWANDRYSVWGDRKRFARVVYTIADQCLDNVSQLMTHHNMPYTVPGNQPLAYHTPLIAVYFAAHYVWQE